MVGLIHFGMAATDGVGSVHTAAGCFIAAEAGAIVTDLETQQEWSLDTRSVMIASNRALHDELSDLLVKSGAMGQVGRLGRV